MKLQDQPAPDYRSPGALMDGNGQVVANVHVNLSPARSQGEFRLPTSARPEGVLGATFLQTADGQRFQITDIHQTPGYHTIAPDQPLFEFHFQAA
jgi:hypothetical protein